MRPLLGLLAIVLLGVGAAACGGAHKTSGTASQSSPVSTGATDPATSPGPGAPTQGNETEKNSILDFGHAAGTADRRAVIVLLRRYYAAAASKDGATACSLILSSVANTVPEDYGQAPGPPYLRGGKTCQAVMSRLFIHLHRRLVLENTTLKVTRVRLKVRGGYAVLRFKSMPEREINIVRERGAWKVASLLDSELS